MLNWIRKNKSDIQFFAIFLLCFGLFRSVAYASYHIPSESMVPTLEVGDRIIVSKWAYGFSRHSVWFPFFPSLPTSDGRVFGKVPERGEVVVFKHTRDNIVMIKRVVGLPGDRIQLRGGRLYVNGQIVDREQVDAYKFREKKGAVVSVRQFTESLPMSKGDDFEHVIIEKSDNWHSDNVGPVVVPDGHLFMMGDNRDNSSDSRAFSRLGFVPVENVMGRADLILLSFHSCKKEEGLTCAKKRFFAPIN